VIFGPYWLESSLHPYYILYPFVSTSAQWIPHPARVGAACPPFQVGMRCAESRFRFRGDRRSDNGRRGVSYPRPSGQLVADQDPKRKSRLHACISNQVPV